MILYKSCSQQIHKNCKYIALEEIKVLLQSFLKDINTFMNLAKNQVEKSVDLQSDSNGAMLKSSVASILDSI